MTFERVCVVLARLLGCNEAQFSYSTELADLKIDSFEAVELLSSLEEEFGVRLKTAYIKKLKTVGDVVCLIDRLKTDG